MNSPLKEKLKFVAIEAYIPDPTFLDGNQRQTQGLFNQLAVGSGVESIHGSFFEATGFVAILA